MVALESGYILPQDPHWSPLIRQVADLGVTTRLHIEAKGCIGLFRVVGCSGQLQNSWDSDTSQCPRVEALDDNGLSIRLYRIPFHIMLRQQAPPDDVR